MKRTYVVKCDACYLDHVGANTFSQRKALKFTTAIAARAYIKTCERTQLRVVRIVRRLKKKALISVAGMANLVLEESDGTEQNASMSLALDRLQRALIAAGIRVPLESEGADE